MPLEGDLAKMVLPSEDYKEVLKNPFGFKAVLSSEKYAAPNRFFFHASIAFWFKNVPHILQGFIDPISSVYASAALAKILIQITILFLLAYIIGGFKWVWNGQTILALGVLFPLFQTEGYNANMGVIDMSISYTFGYAYSMIFLLLLFLLIRKIFLNEIQGRGSFNGFVIPVFGLVCLFNGPLNSAVVIVSALATVFYVILDWNAYVERLRKLTWKFFVPVFILVVIAAFSTYVGTLNSENFGEGIGIFERYQRLPFGLLKMLTSDLGLVMLIGLSMFSSLLILRFSGRIEQKKMRNFGVWILIFSLVYLFLLPLGGFRDYRPDIVRRDSVLPILLLLFIYFGWTALIVLRTIKGRSSKYYTAVLLGVLVIYSIADASKFDKNQCEKICLELIQSSPDKTVRLHEDCTVLSWKKILNPDYSNTNAEMLFHWGITNEVKAYYHEE